MNDNESKSLITIDGDLSKGKIEFLINLGYEEERLDYKRIVDVKKSQKGKIDIVCDIISFSNGDGGYIILGVDEIDKKFKPVGCSENDLKYFDGENLESLVSTYVSKNPKFIVKQIEINGLSFIVLYIFSSNVIIPFDKDGQFHDGNKSKTKFRSGEIFIRNGSQCKRADYHDINKIIDRTVQFKVDRLLNQTDKSVVESNNAFENSIKFFSNSLEALENRFYTLMVDKTRKRFIIRNINSIFSQIRVDVEGILSETSLDFRDIFFRNRLAPIFDRLVSCFVGLTSDNSYENNIYYKPLLLIDV